MQHALAIARRVANSDAPVLLIGESGVGKSTLAAAIHDWSVRRDGPFVAIDCNAADQLHPNSLFSDAAHGGTLFFDEIGALTAEIHATLLRLLTERRLDVRAGQTVETDARVLAASARDLEADARAGRFAEDLFFLLSVVTIRLPPLRERLEDLARLTDHVLATLAARHRRGFIAIAPAARTALARYRWPGNIHELVSVLERALILAKGDAITTAHLPEHVLAARASSAEPSGAVTLSLDELRRRHIQRALTECATLQQAAARLGINPTTLWRRRKRYGLQ